MAANLALLAYVSSILTVVLCRPPGPQLGSLDNDEYAKLSPTEDAHLFDLSCHPCSPGWGVKWICNGSSNTVCIPCPSGTWSPKRPHFRPCSPCSKCGVGLYEDIPCSNTRDTKCDSCSNVKGHFNDDYKKKCDWRQAPDTLKSASDEDDQYSDEDSDRVDDGHMPISMDTKYGTRIKNGKSGKIPVFDENAVRQRIMEKLKELAEKLEKKPMRDDESSSEDEDESDEEEFKPSFPHVIRPLPRVMPGLIKPVSIENSWEEDAVDDRKDNTLEVNYPPSYHSYPIEAMMHTEQQRRKGLVLMAVTAITVIVAVGFILIYSIMFRKRQRSVYGTVSQVNLSPEEREIVRNSANRLEEIEKPVKRYHFGSSGYKPLIDAESNESLCITENPLEVYLNDDGKNGLREETPVNKM